MAYSQNQNYQQNNQYPQQNPYSQGPSTEQGYGYGNQEHELQSYPQQGNTQYASSSLPQQEFLQRISLLRDQIGRMSQNVRQIQTLHQQALDSTESNQSNNQLEGFVSQTQSLARDIRAELGRLATDAHATSDGTKSLKDRQVSTIKNEFERELRGYQSEESSFRQRYRDQIARQYQIVNPDASQADIQQAADADWGNEGVFQTALRTNRTGQATSVLGNVRARHNELQRIEQTLMELADMFNNLGTLVEQQDVAVQAAEVNAENTTKWTEEGNAHVNKGIKSARNTRKWKWWCLGIVVLIIAIIAIALGVYFSRPKV